MERELPKAAVTAAGPGIPMSFMALPSSVQCGTAATLYAGTFGGWYLDDSSSASVGELQKENSAIPLSSSAWCSSESAAV